MTSTTIPNHYPLLFEQGKHPKNRRYDDTQKSAIPIFVLLFQKGLINNDNF